jgi:hypothetical protein
MYGGSRDQLRPMTEEAASRCVQGLLVMPLFAWRDRFSLDAQSGRAFAFSRGVLHGGEGQKKRQKRKLISVCHGHRISRRA